MNVGDDFGIQRDDVHTGGKADFVRDDDAIASGKHDFVRDDDVLAGVYLHFIHGH